VRRRDFLPVPLFPWMNLAAWQDAGSPEPVPEPHFPSRLHQFIWRNWELASVDRMAKVLRTTPGKILELGLSMGLPEKRTLTPNQFRRLYITVIRQNWHLLPEDQIIELLGWTEDRYRFTLKEDDFLDSKLGLPKPRCSQLLYAAPTPEARTRAAQIRQIVEETFGASIHERGEDLLQFIQELSDQSPRRLRSASAQSSAGEIELTQGWTIIEPSGEVLASAARRFKSYLQDAMGVHITLSPAAMASGKRIRLAVLGGAAQTESFEITATDYEIAVIGGGEAGVLQGLYWVQDAMEQREGPFLPKGIFQQRAVWNPRYLYSYFAVYGDPLMEADTNPFPDGYLEKLARCGINGVWMQAVLSTLAPSRQFPEFGAGWEMRLRNLGALVARARRFGVQVYLYLNEPRAMADDFFQRHPEVRGSSHLGLHAMCTSVPSVREWIAESLEHVVRNVPDLGGFFSITMSENHTNCFSHGGEWEEKAPNAGDCPRCSTRKSWEVIGELIHTFRDGVRRVGTATDVIAWDWGWGDELAVKLIPRLPRDVVFLSVSEWELPLRRGGISTKVGEYSISAVGPGPRAVRNWERARSVGIRTMAKTQFNNTWEISAVPYIPVTHLILRHCENLARSGISGIMPGWTCGGYASPNLAAAQAYSFEPRKKMDEILVDVAGRCYGKAAAPSFIEAWRQFSTAFEQFPYSVAIYDIPVQHGPANPLRLEPTGYRPSMILFPYDDYKAWSGDYPPWTVHEQFSKMASLWKEGLRPLQEGLTKVPDGKRKIAGLDLAIAETCHHHFQSVANQVEFYLFRDKLTHVRGSGRAEILKRMRTIAEQEIELARQQFLLARRNSTIGFEASNHYYFTPLDLVEKVLNCRDIMARMA
jgi:hypothetical protein